MKEIRVCEIRADAAAAGAAKVLKLEGRPIVYDQPTTITIRQARLLKLSERGRWIMRTCPTRDCSTITT